MATLHFAAQHTTSIEQNAGFRKNFQ